MATRSKFKDPGLILTVFLVAYALLVFVWWPADIYVAGITLVAWLMFIGLFYWFFLGVIYTLWIEKIEKNNK